jgi:hypothetical protein
MLLFRDGLEMLLAHGRPGGIGHHGCEQPAQMERVIVNAAQVMVRGIARFLMLQDGEEMIGFSVEQLHLAQPQKRLTAKRPLFAVPRFGDARIHVGVDHVLPGPLHQFGRLCGEIGLRHGAIEHRLLDRLIFTGYEPVGGDGIAGLQAFLTTRDFVLEIEDAILALIEPVTILHELSFQTNRLSAFASTRE